MGHVFDFEDTARYEAWLSGPGRSLAHELERGLVHRLLKPLAGERILDIGCGPGRFLEHFIKAGLNATGLDPSPYMLDKARRRTRGKAELVRGKGEDLPFEDNAFDLCCIVVTLEFADDPEKLFAEAVRVTRRKVVVGCVNRYAVKSLEHRLRRCFTNTVFKNARFFSVWDLKRMARQYLGPAPVVWRTTCHFPAGHNTWLARLEGMPWLQCSPFGSFAALAVECAPRFRLRPLALLEHGAPKHGSLVAGPASPVLRAYPKSASWRVQGESFHGSLFV